jgi:multidrug efflux pump
VIILALTSDTKTPGQIYDAVSNVVSQRLSQVTGVGDVEIGGGSLPAVRVSVNPFLLNTLRHQPRGRPRRDPIGQRQPAQGRGRGRWPAVPGLHQPGGRKAADYAGLLIAWRGDAGVKLSDVATVTDSVADTRTIGLFNGKPAIIVLITREPGANIIETVDSVRATLPELRPSCPATSTSRWRPTAPTRSAPPCTRSR